MSDRHGPTGGGFTRRLGLLDCVFLSVGGMIGSAIFIFPGTTGQLIGPASVLAWVAAGLLMSAIALTYTELSLAFPHVGGPAVYPYETFGPRPALRSFASYLEGVCYCVGWGFGITFSALAIASYAAVIVPGLGSYGRVLPLVAILLSFVVNVVGVDVTSRTNLVFSALLLAVLVAFIALGLAHASPGNYRPFLTGGPLAFLAAVQVATVGFGAWTVITATAGEIKRPRWTIPRAILASLAITVLLYAGIDLALHGVVPPGAFVQGSAVASTPLGVAAMAFGIPVFSRFILPLAAIAAIFTTMLVGTLSASRVLYVLGENGTLPAGFASMSERFDVPWVGVVAITLLAGAFAAFPNYFFQLVVVSAVLGTGVPYAINILSFIGLRYYRPDIDPGYRAPGGYALAVVAFVALAIAMIGLATTELAWSIGAVVPISAYFVIRYWRRPDAFSRAADLQT